MTDPISFLATLALGAVMGTLLTYRVLLWKWHPHEEGLRPHDDIQRAQGRYREDQSRGYENSNPTRVSFFDQERRNG